MSETNDVVRLTHKIKALEQENDKQRQRIAELLRIPQSEIVQPSISLSFPLKPNNEIAGNAEIARLNTLLQSAETKIEKQARFIVTLKAEKEELSKRVSAFESGASVTVVSSALPPPSSLPLPPPPQSPQKQVLQQQNEIKLKKIINGLKKELESAAKEAVNGRAEITRLTALIDHISKENAELIQRQKQLTLSLQHQQQQQEGNSKTTITNGEHAEEMNGRLEKEISRAENAERANERLKELILEADSAQNEATKMIAKLTEQKEECVGIARQLQRENEELRSHFENTTNELSVLHDALNVSEQRNQELTREISLLKLNNQSSTSTITQPPPPPSSLSPPPLITTTTTATANNDNNDNLLLLKQENERLITITNAKDKEIGTLKTEITRILKEFEEATKKAEVKEQEAESLAKDLAAVVSENQELNAQFTDINCGISKNKEMMESLKERVQRGEQRIRTLDIEKQRMNMLNNKLTEENGKLIIALEKAEKVANSVRNDAISKEAQKERARNEAESARMEVESLKEEMRKREKQFEAIIRRAEEAEADAQAQREEKERVLVDLGTSNQLYVQLCEIREQILLKLADTEAELSKYEVKVKRIEQERESLGAQLQMETIRASELEEKLKSQPRNNTGEIFQQPRMRELEDALSEMRKRMEKLTSEKLQAIAEVTRLGKVVTNLEKERTELRGYCAKYEKELQRYEAHIQRR